jgi:hypothetical protein
LSFLSQELHAHLKRTFPEARVATFVPNDITLSQQLDYMSNTTVFLSTAGGARDSVLASWVFPEL